MVLYNPLPTLKLVMLTLVDPDEKDEDNPFYLPERPIETVTRRLKELHLTVEDMHSGLYRQSPGVERMKALLAEEVDPTYEEMFLMLHYVGMELVAVNDTYQERTGQNGHWFSGGGCQYCGINDLDAMMYNEPDELCPKRPNQTETSTAKVEDVAGVPMADDLDNHTVIPTTYSPDDVDEQDVPLDSPPHLRTRRD